MNDCVFCKIVAGELPAHAIYEDEQFLAFLDINPKSPGHTLVIPKEHYRWVWDMPDEALKGASLVSKKVAHALQKAFGATLIESRVIGDEVPHAHIWLYPSPDEAVGDPKDFSGNAEKVRGALN